MRVHTSISGTIRPVTAVREPRWSFREFNLGRNASSIDDLLPPSVYLQSIKSIITENEAEKEIDESYSCCHADTRKTEANIILPINEMTPISSS